MRIPFCHLFDRRGLLSILVVSIGQGPENFVDSRECCSHDALALGCGLREQHKVVDVNVDKRNGAPPCAVQNGEKRGARDLRGYIMCLGRRCCHRLQAMHSM